LGLEIDLSSQIFGDDVYFSDVYGGVEVGFWLGVGVETFAGVPSVSCCRF
jgi:hypothetical protein